MVKNPPAGAGDTRDTALILGLGRTLGVGNDSPLQYSCLENYVDRGIWQATVHGVTKSQTRLSVTEHTHTDERKVWLREVKKTSQGHTAKRW